MKQFEQLLNKTVSEQSTSVQVNDAILYALSLGFGADDNHLKFVYEKDLSVLPGMAMILAYPGFWISEPKYGFYWTQVLHAEESMSDRAEALLMVASRAQLTDKVILPHLLNGRWVIGDRYADLKEMGRDVDNPAGV